MTPEYPEKDKNNKPIKIIINKAFRKHITPPLHVDHGILFVERVWFHQFQNKDIDFIELKRLTNTLITINHSGFTCPGAHVIGSREENGVIMLTYSYVDYY